MKAALLGQGLVLFPTWLISEELSEGSLIPLLQDWRSEVSDGQRALYVLTPQRRLGVPKVSAFIDFIFEQVTPLPSWDCWKNRA